MDGLRRMEESLLDFFQPVIKECKSAVIRECETAKAGRVIYTSAIYQETGSRVVCMEKKCPYSNSQEIKGIKICKTNGLINAVA